MSGKEFRKKCMEKNPGGQKCWQRGGGEISWNSILPPSKCVLPHKCPPKFRDLAPPLLEKQRIGRLLWPQKLSRARFHFACLENEISLRELTLYKTLSSNQILSSLIYDKLFHCSTTWMDEDTRLHNWKWLFSVNQSLHLTKDRFAWIILSYVF